MSRHYVQPQLGFHRTLANFGRPLSDDQLLFAALYDSLKNVLFSVIQALVALVHSPEPEHPLRGDLAEEYTKDRKKFMKNAEEFTKKHGDKRPSD